MTEWFVDSYSPIHVKISSLNRIMTRWARHKGRKRPSDATKWEDLKDVDGRERKNIYTQSTMAGTQLRAVRNVAVKKNKRTENRRLKRQRRKIDKMVCFHCRMPGHGMADCPRLLDDCEQGTGVCFKCGSTEHSSHACTAKVQPGNEFAFAKCFVCGEQGHLSKSCPDNPRGLYPNGGCCKLCGSVDHYQRDCPERRVKGEVTAYRLPNRNSSSSEMHVSLDDEITLYESDEEPKKVTTVPKKPKVVKF